MTESLFLLIIERYAQLNDILVDVIKACGMDEGEEREALVETIVERTNHQGIHYTQDELSLIFLGSVK